MPNKIVVKNNYHKMLSFGPLIGKPFSMDGGEIKTVDYNIAIKLLSSIWITRVEDEFKIESSCVICQKPITKEVKVILKQKPKMKKSINRYNKGRSK